MPKRMAKLVAVFLLGGAVLWGCTEATPNYCQKPGDCTGGRVCDVARGVCVSPDGATGPMDGPAAALDGATLDAVDAPSGGEVREAIDLPSTIDAILPIDAPALDEAMEAGPHEDAGVVDVAGPDLYVPDGAGTCGASSDCPDPTKAFCVAGLCVGCQAGLDGGANACVAPTAVCDSLSGRCVACTADSHCTSSKSPICNKTNNTCAACTVSSQCAGLGDPNRAACSSAGTCVQCTANTDCSGTTPVCDTTSNKCVQCVAHAQCSGTTPICSSSKTCTGCTATSPCAALADPNRAVCVNSGACVQCTSNTQCSGSTPVCNTTTNTCVQCTTNANCSGATPICDSANKCQACKTGSECQALADPNRAVCATSGTASGACVQCAASSDCTAATHPICSSANTCVSCKADAECAAKLGTTGNPGVCMANIDGHCATDAETVYVQNKTGCSDSNPGSAAAPICSAQAGVTTAKSNSKALVVITGALAPGSATIAATAPLTIAGKSSAKLTPTTTGSDGITITSGEIYLRGVAVQGGTLTGMGINASPTSGSSVSLHVDTCAVINNPGGGILLNGAAFDIENTIITGNGPGQTTGGTFWGGIRVDGLPSSGPAILNLVTVENNNPVGISCSGSITGTGVLVTGNTSAQIANSCGLSSCSPTPDGGTGCGAQ